MDMQELAWASGLFEGEGSITQHANRSTDLLYVNLHMAMTDADSVERFHAAVGGLGKVYVRRNSGKPLYSWQANSFENAQTVIAMLWYGLGERRRARAVELFGAVQDSQSRRKNMRRGETCMIDRCSNPVWARGLCNKDYIRARNAAKVTVGS